MNDPTALLIRYGRDCIAFWESPMDNTAAWKKKMATQGEVEQLAVSMARDAEAEPKPEKRPRCPELNEKGLQCRRKAGHKPECEFESKWSKPEEVIK